MLSRSRNCSAAGLGIYPSPNDVPALINYYWYCLVRYRSIWTLLFSYFAYDLKIMTLKRLRSFILRCAVRISRLCIAMEDGNTCYSRTVYRVWIIFFNFCLHGRINGCMTNGPRTNCSQQKWALLMRNLHAVFCILENVLWSFICEPFVVMPNKPWM